MLKFYGSGEKDGQKRNFIGMGITLANIQRMLNGEPIFVRGEDVGTPGTDILLFAGKTELELHKSLKDAGIDAKHEQIDFRLLQEQRKNKNTTQ